MRDKDLLFRIADSQQGYFTSQQAERCGFSRANFHRKLFLGEWIKVQRGIYRLSHYPTTERPELVLWCLWSRNRKGEVQGVWSHETALDIYDLCDVMPAKMHMTVPRSFRKMQVPKALILHHADLSPSEVQSRQGYQVTTPLKTLIDIVSESSLSEDLIVQALQEGMRKGLILRNELKDIILPNSSIKLRKLLDDYSL